MAAPSVLQGNVHVLGQLSASSMALPADAVSDNNIAANAAIEANKLKHQHVHRLRKAVPATDEETVHIPYGDGDVVQFSASCRTAPASGKSYKVDLEKNGSSILTAPIEFTNSSTPLVLQVATLSATNIANGDVLSVVVTDVSGGTLGTDLFVQLITDETYQPL